MDIESLSTSEIQRRIAMTKNLHPYINNGDKEPSWDGSIYVYENEKKQKDHLIGRIPVQVKGKLVEDLSKDTITYPVKVSDLNNYLKDVGAIFFIVYITNDWEVEVYYECFLPFLLNKWLRNTNNTSTISLAFKKLPKQEDKIYSICLNFLEDSGKQRGTLDTNITSLLDIDIKEIDSIASLTCEYIDMGENNSPFEYLFKNRFYLYAEPKGFGVKIPVACMESIEEISIKSGVSISINHKVFYDSYDFCLKEDCKELRIGKSFKFKLYEGYKNKFYYNITGNLEDRIRDLEFLLEVNKQKHFYLGNIKVPIIKPVDTTEELNDNLAKDTLEYLKTVKKVLEILNIQQDLELDSITSKEESDLNMLIKTILYDEVFEYNYEKFHNRIKMKISNINLLLFLDRIETSKYTINNFFSLRNGFYLKDENDNKIPTSHFVTLEKEDFLTISNINYEVILKSIKTIEASEPYCTQVNQLLLEMLKAYDQIEINKTELLFAATEIANWLVSQNNYFPPTLAKINYLQCIFRKRELNDIELQEVHSIILNNTESIDISIGCHLILGNFTIAEKLMLELSPLEREQLKSCPIYQLLKKNNV